MINDALFKILSAIHPLSEDFKKAIETELIPLSLPKNHILLEAPAIAGHAYFLEKGFAMAYSFEEGRKITEAFWRSGQIMVSSHSFFEQVPSMEYIQLMEKSELLCISYAGIQRMFELHPEAHAIYRVIMNRHYAHSRGRVRDLQYLSALQRHEKLLNVFPNIEQIVPQDCIASYLGITPQSLSRLKRQQGNS